MRIFGRKKVEPESKPKSFDRAARDSLHRRRVSITGPDDRVMLIGDSRGEFFLVEPGSMRVVFEIKRAGLFGPHIKLGPRVTLKS